VAPGICLRLWTEAQDRLLQPAMRPEIEDADLARVVLAAAQWGTTDRCGMPWLTPPPAASWENAKSLLRLLGALDKDGRLTPHGARMAQMAAHPRLANMILRTGNTLWAAILEEGAPHALSDIRDVRPTARMQALARRWGASRPCEAGEALAYAFPDRIARNRGNGTFHMTGGRGAYMERTEALASCAYLVLCDLDDRGGDAKIHLAAPLSEAAIEEIFAGEICEDERTYWDKRQECAVAVKERRLWRMVMRSQPSAAKDPARIQLALFEGIRQKGIAQLPCWSPFRRQLQARILFLRRVLGEAWPDVSDEGLAAHLETWFAGFTMGMSRWSHLEKLDLEAVLFYALSEAGLDGRTLERLAPVKMVVPSGSHVTLHYEGDEPFAAVRLQECFGLKETPKLADGRINVVMHLLSPAQRPVQITKDLEGFWKTSYQSVRKDLRGRYPKHYWPEDPLTAVATRRVRPPGA
jgi:ATP-dependent helicase HrpB